MANGQWFTQISNGTLTLLDTTSQNETFKGTKGDDTFAGGFGNDTYVIKSPGDTVTENPLGGIDTELASITTTLAANVENLRLTGKAAINGTGNALDNVLAGNAAANVLDGGAGNDVLIGGSGDTLIGGKGDDLLTDVGNNDTLTGGLGADIFQISATGTGSHAEITDFSVSDGDAISLLLLDADPRTAMRNAFTFVGAHGFSGTVGELRYAFSGGNTFIYGDTNGDRAPDFTIMVDGIHTFTAADFLL